MLLVTKDGQQYCVARKADVMVVLSDHAEQGKLVRIVLAEGRAYSRLSLVEFCELVAEIREEIIRHRWHPSEVGVSLTAETPNSLAT